MIVCSVFIIQQVYHILDKYVQLGYVLRDTSPIIGQLKRLCGAYLKKHADLDGNNKSFRIRNFIICIFTMELIKVKELIQLKVISTKNTLSVTISFLIMDLSFIFFCNGRLRLEISDVAIITVKVVVNYCCIFSDINKSKEVHFLQNPALDDCRFI